MAIANVALTDTFDYWRSVTNSLVVAINDKLVYCNTSNANTVSIPSFASRTSNLYVNIITSTSLNDTATGNVASAFTANTLQGLALVYTASANSNARISVASANAWTNAVAAASNTWANTVGTSGNAYAVVVGASSNAYTNVSTGAANNYCGSLSNAVNSYSISTYAPIVNPTFTSNVTINNNLTVNKISNLGGVNEKLSSINTNISGVQNFDCANNYVFYVNNVVGPFTPNLQNFVVPANTATSVTIFIDQGASANITTGNILIGAANLAINWQGGAAPTGTASKKDIVTLSILNVNGSNTVIGQLVSFG